MKQIFKHAGMSLIVLSLLVLPVIPAWAQQYYYGGSYNAAPTWKEMRGPNLTVAQGQTLTTTFEAEDYNGDFLVYSSVSLPAGASFNPATRVFTFTPNFNQLGSFPVVLSVTDNKSAPVIKTFYVVVTSASSYYGNQYYPYNNQAPYFTATQSYYEVSSGNTLRFTVRATDPNSDPIYFSALGVPAGATFNQHSGEFMWTPRSGERGIYTVRFTAHDQSNASVALSVTIVVDGGTHTIPVLTPSGQTIATYTSGGIYTPEPEVGGPYYAYPQQYPVGASSIASLYYPSAGMSSTVSPKITYKTKTTEKINYVYVDSAPTKSEQPYRAPTASYASYPTQYTAGAVLINAGRVVPTYPVTTAAYDGYGAGSYGATRLSAFNIAVRAAENGQMSVTWDTSKPAKSEVVFGYSSHPRSDNWNVILNYDFTTGENNALVTRHSVSLGKLEFGRTYYMRVISRTDRETDISREIVFIPMESPTGPAQVDQYDGSASASYTAGSVITSTGLLTVLALIAAVMIMYLIFQRRQPRYHSRTTTTEIPDLHIEEHPPTNH